MLANDFYTVIDKRHVDGGFEVEVEFNEKHPIYKAHFPENPITPGVCILQVAKELLVVHYNMPLTLVNAKNIKFLNILDPVKSPKVWFIITSGMDDEGVVKSNVLIKNEMTTFAKISSTYKPV